MSTEAAEMITCREFVELVTDYLEGRLSSEDRDRFERHVEACPGCQAYIEQMRVTLRALGRIPEESLAPDAREELLHTFRAWKSSR